MVPGGGVFTYATTVTVRGSFITNNRASAGAGLWATGNLSIDHSVISDNFSYGSAGGLSLGTGQLIVVDSTFARNTAHNGNGGGISVNASTGAIAGSTINDNAVTSSYSGGGLALTGSDLQLENCTIYGNSSVAAGGALWLDDASSILLHSVTVSENVGQGGIAVSNAGVLTLSNAIISGTCENAGLIVSNGGNMESPADTCGLAAEDQIVADPMLSHLGAFGGPTATVLPLTGSPAIDSGKVVLCLTTDQRGLDRNVGPCDVGAVERQPDDVDPMIFTDGFESGNTSSWSDTS